MLKIELSSPAENDLEEIWFYTYSTWSESQANHYHDTLMKFISRFINNNTKPKTFHFGGKKFNYFKFEKHVIFYSLVDDKIRILRILHEAMDFTRHL